MRPATRNLEIYAGDPYEHQITLTDNSTPPVPLPLDDYAFIAQIRKRAGELGEPLAEFVIEVVGDPADGVILLTLTEEDTTALPTTCAWDLKASSDGGPWVAWLAGQVDVTRDVSHHA